jgi:hypothetical protein
MALLRKQYYTVHNPEHEKEILKPRSMVCVCVWRGGEGGALLVDIL